MRIINSTPFAHLVFESLDEQDQPILIGVLQGTFAYDPSGRLLPSVQQQDLKMADEYFGAPLVSSLKIDSQLVPKRYHTDITLDAIAVSPKGRPADAWSVGVRVGSVEKIVRVTGPRHWEHRMQDWKLSHPSPVVKVPIRYDMAFGGAFEVDGRVIRFEENPVGTGFVNLKELDKSRPLRAPQIEDTEMPISSIEGAYNPVGLGPVPKHCLPRRNLCGTADAHWEKTRWPLRPIDFSFLYYNAASPGLRYNGFLKGDEPVSLVGMSEIGRDEFALPGINHILFLMDGRRNCTIVRMNLDSVHIVTDNSTVLMTWRAVIQKSLSCNVLQFSKM